MSALDGHYVVDQPIADDSEHNNYLRPMCGEQYEGYGCTRRVGHRGQHEAAGFTEIKAVWP